MAKARRNPGATWCLCIGFIFLILVYAQDLLSVEGSSGRAFFYMFRMFWPVFFLSEQRELYMGRRDLKEPEKLYLYTFSYQLCLVMWGRPVFFRVPKSRPSHPYMNSLFSYFFLILFTFFVQLYRIIGEVVFGKKNAFFQFWRTCRRDAKTSKN